MLRQITGWCGVPAGRAEGHARLAGMLESSASSGVDGDGAHRWARLDDASALAQSGATRSTHPVRQAPPWCAVDGHPRWSDRRMAEIARVHGDGAALADGFARHDVDVLRFVGGRFRLAVVEPHRVLLAVDRVATLPLYCARTDRDGVVFASSLRALRAHPAVGQRLSAQALAEYFHFQVVLGAGTVFDGIEKLPPAHRFLLDRARCTIEPYWQPRYAPPRHCSTLQVLALRDELRARLRESVAREIDGVEAGEIGAFLSGGLDSSTVVGLVTERLGTRVPTFTVRFDVPGYDESSYATLAARHFGARAHVYTLTARDMARDLERIAHLFDEPFANSSAAGAHRCATLAREAGVRTMLSGDGGDELFAGGSDYVLMQRFELFNRLPAPVRSGLELALAHLPGVDRVPALARALHGVRRARIPMPARARSYEYLTTSTYRGVFTPEFLDAIDPDRVLGSLEHTYSLVGSGDALQRHLRLAMCTVVAGNDVPKVTRSCELEGIEARFPLLDDGLHEFVATVPSNVLIRHLRERAFYRETLRGFLPPEILQKTKHCFTHPLRQWLSGPSPLRRAVVESLDGFARRGIVCADLLQRLIAEPALAARPEMTQLMWYAAVLERWLRAHRLDLWSSGVRAGSLSMLPTASAPGCISV